jgi:hypothetical protein
MESIQKWLDTGCKYPEGVALYATMPGCMPVLLKRLQEGHTPVKHEKLKYELRKILKQNPAPVPAPTPVPAAAAKPIPMPVPVTAEPRAPDAKQKLLFHQLPPELRPVLQEANALFAEKCLLKTMLNDLAPEMESEALELCIRIYSLTQKNARCWQKIDYWKEHRALPPLEAPKHYDLGGAQLAKKQQNLFSSISRLKKRLEQNRLQYEAEERTAARARLLIAIAKKAGNLIKQEDELLAITSLIESKA